MAFYTNGTVSTDGSATITGTGTNFTQAMVGKGFETDDYPYTEEIASVTSATVLTLKNPWSGANGSGKNYRIGSHEFDIEVIRRIKTLLTTYETLVGNSGSDKIITLDKTSTGDEAAIYFKVGSSGRMRIGLIGDNKTTLDVSSNGSTWTTAIEVDETDGNVSFPTSAVAMLEDENTFTEPQTFSDDLDIGGDAAIDGSLTVGGVHISSQLSSPNLLVNPAFQIAQRGDGPFSISGYSVDGFKIGVGSASPSITLETLTGAEADAAGVEHFLRYDSTGQAGTYQSISMRIEDVMQFGDQDIVLSFEARCASAQIISTMYAYQEFGSGGSAHAYKNLSVNVSVGTSWAKITKTIKLGSISGKTIGPGHHLLLSIALAGASASFEGVFDIRKPKLELGSIATPFIRPHEATEMAKARRYFQRWDNAQDVDDLAYEMRATPSQSGSGPYDYSAEF